MGVAMNFDIGEVLSHAWQITWKHRVLWIIGILTGLFGSIIFPLMFSPILFPVFMQNSKTDVRPLLGVMIGLIIALLLFILVFYPVSVLSQTSITLGVLNANNDNSDNLSATDLIKQSRPFFWRVLGIMLLYAVGIGLISLIIQAVLLLLTIVTLGLAALCMMPLTFLMYPLLFGSIVWMEQAMNGIIVDNMTIEDAVRQGWNYYGCFDDAHDGPILYCAVQLYGTPNQLANFIYFNLLDTCFYSIIRIHHWIFDDLFKIRMGFDLPAFHAQSKIAATSGNRGSNIIKESR